MIKEAFNSDKLVQNIELPEVGVHAIKLLNGGLTVKEVQEQLKQKLNEDFNVKSFVFELIDVGFVESIDEYVLEMKREIKKEEVFSKPLTCLSTFLIVAGFLIVVLNPRYWPSYQDLFFHERYTVVVLVSFALGWLLVFTHEMAHLFAAESVGVEGRFGISNRLHYVVAETDLTNLWKAPRSRRYIVYLASMISDLVIASVLIILIWLSDSHVLGGSGGVLYRIEDDRSGKSDGVIHAWKY